MRKLLSILVGAWCIVWSGGRADVSSPHPTQCSPCLARHSTGFIRRYRRSRPISQNTAPPLSGLQRPDLAPAGSSSLLCSVVSSLRLAFQMQSGYQVSSASSVVGSLPSQSPLSAHYPPLASNRRIIPAVSRIADICYWSLEAP